MLDLPAKPDWKALTREQRLELMEPYRLKGIGSVQIAAQFTNATRNAVCGALDRAGRKLLSRQSPGRPSLGESAMRANGNKGQPKAAAIRHKYQGLAFKIAQARKDGMHGAEAMAAVLSHRPAVGYKPTNAAVWEPLGDAKPIDIMDLPGSPGVLCRWPVRGGYCGIQSGARTYCDHHHVIAYKSEGKA